MSVRHYRLLLGFAASLSLSLAGCGGVARSPSGPPDTVAGTSRQQAAQSAEDEWTEQTLWTWLGFAKLPSKENQGPQTGALVSPVMWEAAQNTLSFAGISSEDPVTGLLVTKWYSPPDKPNERVRVSVFILSRALRSDSLAVTVQRETRTQGGPWKKAPVARSVPDGIDFAILTQAQRIHAERYREANYSH
jgi:Domain of unknown function (DUF3576)